MHDPSQALAKPLPAPSAMVLAATATPAPDASTWSRQELALAILAGIAMVCALDWAQAFFISMLLGILFAYTLAPLVAWLQRLHVPRVIGTTVVMTSVVAALGLGAYSLRGQTQTILDQVPEAVSRVSAGLARASLGKISTMQKVQTAATTIEQAASAATDTAVAVGTAQEAPTPATPIEQAISAATDEAAATRTPSTRVVIDAPAFKVSDFLLAGSKGAAGIIGQIAMVVFLTFFLLLSGDTYRRKLVRLTGPTLSDKKITVHILDGINQSIQRYMFMLLVTNVLIGLLTWIALRLIGLETAGAWAVAAGMLHVIPYLGPGVTAAGIAMTAFVQFDAVPTAVLAGGASLVIATIVGTFVTTWMTGRIASMNTAAVFVLLLFWTWLWGVWGMLLSIPITVIIMAVAVHVKSLQSVAELLGD